MSSAPVLIAGAVIPIVITPGASFTLTVATSAAGVPRAGAHVALGTAGAVAVIAACACASPLGALVSGSATLRAVLACVGGGALVVLALRTAAGVLPSRAPVAAADRAPERGAAVARRAFLATIGNPKALTVYLAVVPAIATAADDPLPAVGAAFAAVHIAATFGWLGTVGWAVARLPLLTGGRARRALRLASAAWLAATGGALAISALA
jgi:threonine/homoserine/homoserine lactone efflux protein